MPADTPPMGWNSWNMFGATVNAEVIRQTADAFVSSGLKDAGYRYVVIDDFWQGGRGEDGKLFPDPQRFPEGLKALADYVHARGLFSLACTPTPARRRAAGAPPARISKRSTPGRSPSGGPIISSMTGATRRIRAQTLNTVTGRWPPRFGRPVARSSSRSASGVITAHGFGARKLVEIFGAPPATSATRGAMFQFPGESCTGSNRSASSSSAAWKLTPGPAAGTTPTCSSSD